MLGHCDGIIKYRHLLWAVKIAQNYILPSTVILVKYRHSHKKERKRILWGKSMEERMK